jgi:hypothetical protein
MADFGVRLPAGRQGMRNAQKEEIMRIRSGYVLVFLGILFFIGMAQECLADVAIEQVVKDKDGRPSKVLIYYSEDRFRSDRPEVGLTTIIDFKGDRMMMIDHRSRNYVDVPFSRWEKEVAERLKKSAPRTKTKPRKITVQKTGETQVINGFQTEKILVYGNGELIEENWTTRDVEMKEVEQVMEKVAKGFSKDFKLEMMEGREIYEKLKPHGYPILVKDHSKTYGLGGLEVLEVKKLEKKELGDDVFLPPADYNRIIPEPSKK